MYVYMIISDVKHNFLHKEIRKEMEERKGRF